MKIFHTGDWHFREKDHDEIYKCVRFIVDAAIKEEPDLICISGDITDSRHLDFDSRSARSILSIVQFMLNIAPVAIVIGTPPHDGKAALALRACKGKYPIIVSDMPEQVGYYLGTEDTLSIGRWHKHDEGFLNPEFILTQIPQPTKQYFINELSIEDTEKAIGNAMGNMLTAFGHKAESFENVPHIANGHGQIGGAFISDTQQLIGHDIEVSKTQLKALNADLICYGHIHKAQDMGDGIFYAGSPTRMNHGETEDKGFYIHKINYDNFAADGGIEAFSVLDSQSEFIKTPAIYLHDTKLDAAQDGFNPDYMSALKSMCDGINQDHDEWGIKLTITAWQDDAKNFNKAEIEDELIAWGASRIKVAIIRKPRETVRAKKVLEADTLPEKLEAMAELRGEDLSSGVLDKAKAIEAGEKEPWKE